MKKVLFFLSVVLLVAGCRKKEGIAPVHVHVNDFTITQQDYPAKGDPVANYAGVKAITLAFYASDGTQEYCSTQLRDDASTYTVFGEFACSLPMGSYTMVVYGYGFADGDSFVLNSLTEGVFTSAHVRETFVASQEVNVENTSTITVNATMNRVVAKLMLKSTDVRPSNIDSLRFTIGHGGKGVNPLTGLATTNTGFVNTVRGNVVAGQPTTGTTYLFLGNDEQTTTVTIDAIDSDNEVVFHKEVTNVPLQRNKITMMTGEMFTAGAEGSFLINTGYISDTTFVPF